MNIEKLINVEEYVDVDIDVDEIYYNCTDVELEELKGMLLDDGEYEYGLNVENLNDRDKFLIIKDLYDNYSLDDLKKISGWKQGYGINMNL